MSNSNSTIYNSADIFTLNSEKIEFLKNEAYKSKQKRFRYCLHHSNDHLTHEMIIVFHIDTLLIPHRHPFGRSESYHLIEGAMNVYFFDDSGEVIDAIKLEEKTGNTPFLYRMSSHTWHLPVPTSEFMVYHETLTGPFLDESDIEYPDWKNRYDSRKKINSLIDNIKIS